MVNPWQPGVDYNHGDCVEYKGATYRIIQPHFSQGDWTPDVTPALWGREYGAAPTQPPQQSYNQPPPEQRPWDQHDQTKVELAKRKSKRIGTILTLSVASSSRQIGGGLLAGAALLGGGFLAYKKHKENEEDKKALAWGLQNWMTDAQRRSQSFYQGGYSGKPTWVLTKGNRIPQGAFQAGQESDGTHYTSVALSSRGEFIPVKLAPTSRKDVLLGMAVMRLRYEIVQVEDYEILIADHDLSIGPRQVNGPLYIVQAPYKEGTHPGKTGPHLQGADITYGGKEKIVNNYRILVYNY
ncbi:hypothetical protein RhiXN_10488 [Rhizoctonia solani]|uniref:Chitin-binding type-3 domain-containing protein n=1 Tax=Rhizoctonia solani TaxID=456999 RepID=A0A8H8T002_9AGAM|nr:uncharacterized protein RhiXN_10488 [Rhizoctonia solani]QRW24164.1 hypothetical protein RhiXN_10488 [Rhizoctonia solani]